MKCSHEEAKELECCFDYCPRAGYESDWKELTRQEPKCSYIRSDNWKAKK